MTPDDVSSFRKDLCFLLPGTWGVSHLGSPLPRYKNYEDLKLSQVLPCRDLSTSTLLWSWVQPFRISAPNKGRSFSTPPHLADLSFQFYGPKSQESIAQFFTLLAVPSKTGKHIQAKSMGLPCLGLHPPLILIR